MNPKSLRVTLVLAPVLCGALAFSAFTEAAGPATPGGRFGAATLDAKAGAGPVADEDGSGPAASAVATGVDSLQAPLSGKLVYRPPRPGMPRVRVSTEIRGRGEIHPSLYVLAPLETGLTTRDQPNFYFYLSKKPISPVEFAVWIRGSADMVVKDTNLAVRLQKGFNRIRLADYGDRVRLEPGKDYRWGVALVVDPRSRSQDVYDKGGIEFEEPEEALKAKISRTGKMGLAALFVKERFWYDAIESLVTLSNLRPDDEAIKQDLQSLLAQQGLNLAD